MKLVLSRSRFFEILLEPAASPAEFHRMRVEGTQNMSRIPGLYVYPVRRYHTAPVESVPPVEPRRGETDTKRLRNDSMIERYTPGGIERSSQNDEPAFLDRLA